MPRNMVSSMLREGLYTRVVGRRILFFQRLPSTMDEAGRQAREAADQGTVILAEEQTSGRGRFQREWVSPAGNLYLSIVLRPSPQALQYLSIISGVAVVRAIRKTTGLRPTIKWPNDVKIDGKKVCGILVESALQDNRVQYAIVGIGINVAFDPSSVSELAGIATSLNLETGTEVDREVLLRHLLQELDGLYLPLQQAQAGYRPADLGQSFGGDSLDRAKREWRAVLETLSRRVEVRWHEEVYTGYAEDVDEVGNLLLRLEDGTLVALPAGEVTSAAKDQDRG